MAKTPEFPAPIRLNGRLYWRRSELEAYKQEIIRAATGELDRTSPATQEIEAFVAAADVLKEFGFGRRTLGRRIAGKTITAAA